MANKVKKRIFYIDELRAIAILSVILCHTAGTYRPFIYDNLKLAVPGFLNLVGFIGVPLFFMISGALLLNRDYTLSEFFKKRFTRILYPFIFFMVITLLLQHFVLGAHTSQLIKIFFGSDRYTWFVWVIMGIYLFLPVINSFVKEYGLRGVEYFLAIWFVTVILNTAGLYPFYRFDLSYFANFIGYFVLGYYITNKEFNISDKKMMIFSIILFVVTILCNYYMSMHHLLPESKYMCIFTVLSSMAVYLFFKAISSYSENKSESLIGRIHNKIEAGLIGKIILSISVCSYGMYFLNSLLIAFYKTLDIHALKMLPVLFVGIAFLSWFIVFLLDKIPGMKKFVGT